jgi:hypothetical protein
MEELTIDQLSLLKDLYYNKKLFFGRDKLYKYLKDNHENAMISRRQLDKWLKSQATHMIHQRSKSIRDIKTQIVEAPRQVIQIDLANLQNLEKDGYRYIMVGIDMFSKKIYLEPLKDRTAKDILKAFKGIYDRIKTLKMVRSDNEFRNKLLKDFLNEKKIKIVYGEPRRPESQGIVERSNSVVKRTISKGVLNDNDGYNWVKQLKEIEDAINNTISEGVNGVPNEIDQLQKDIENKNTSKRIRDLKKNPLLDYTNAQKKIKGKGGRISKPMFEVGDQVRKFIQRERTTSKFPQRKWSIELFTIDRVNKPTAIYNPYTYKLVGENKIYKNEQLLKVEGNENPATIPDTWNVKKLVKPIIGKFIIDGQNVELPGFVVEWENYDDTTEEPEVNLMKDVPKLVRKFKKDKKISFKKDAKGKWKIIKG